MPVSKRHLEPEIQYLVVKVLVAEFERLSDRMWSREHKEERFRVLTTLLSLRLTCQSFGRANIIKAAVFKEITLQATVLNFNRLRYSRISSIAPFVKKINFLPTPFTISLGLSAFTKLLQILLQHESELPVRCRRHIETHWGDLPTTEVEVAAEFQAYRQQAYMDQDLITSGELQCLWTAALRRLQHANDFELFSLFGRHPLDPSDDSGTLHCMDCYKSKCTLYERTGSCEDQMFRTAIQCLAASTAQIKTMSVHRALAQHFHGWQSASWDRLDLSRLETFKFPDLDVVDDDSLDDYVERDAAAEMALAQFLRKPVPNLRKLSIDHYVEFPRMTWPPQSPFYHPRLRSLNVGGVLLRIIPFAELVTRCVALEEISLRDCHPHGPGGRRLEEPGGEVWATLFDALSRHPNLRRVTVVDEWDSVDNEGIVGVPYNPNTVGVEISRVLLQTGMLLLRNPTNRGIWDDALQVYLGQQQ